MDNMRRRDFVKVMKCEKMLLGQPVLSYCDNYVTVAFDFYPRAHDYERFEQAGWVVHGHLGHNDLCLNIHNRKFFEVTFRRVARDTYIGASPVSIEYQ
jgi:hypothetical protein